MKKTKTVKTKKTPTVNQPKTVRSIGKVKPVLPTISTSNPEPFKLSKPIQSFVGRVSKQRPFITHQPSRLTDIIACPTLTEFKEQVMAIPGVRYEFKGSSPNTARGYVYYAEGYREGAPHRPHIITWVQSPPVPAGTPNTGKFRVEMLDGNTFRHVDAIVLTNKRDAGDHLQSCREAWKQEHSHSMNVDASAMQLFKVASVLMNN